jgi:hypothetical protein
MALDWFRTPSWGGPATSEFEVKLARSRVHNRSEYLKIKALALDDAGDSEAAVGLLKRIIDDYPDSLDYAYAFELQGDILRRDGKKVEAEQCYRCVLDRRPDLNATSGTAPLSLAEVLLEQHGAAAVPEVLSLLAYPHMRLAFNDQMVRALILSARAAEIAGDFALRRSEAQRALALADAGPQLARYPTIGVPQLADRELNELRRLASANEPLPAVGGPYAVVQNGDVTPLVAIGQSVSEEDQFADIRGGQRYAAAWCVAHTCWVSAFLLSIKVGAEQRFCSHDDRPMSDAGPFGTDPDFASRLSGIAITLLCVGFVLAVLTLTGTAWVSRRQRTDVRFAVMNFVLGGLAALATFGWLIVRQLDDGSFCSPASKLAGFLGLGALAATIALLNVFLIRRQAAQTPRSISPTADATTDAP